MSTFCPNYKYPTNHELRSSMSSGAVNREPVFEPLLILAGLGSTPWPFRHGFPGRNVTRGYYRKSHRFRSSRDFLRMKNGRGLTMGYVKRSERKQPRLSPARGMSALPWGTEGMRGQKVAQTPSASVTYDLQVNRLPPESRLVGQTSLMQWTYPGSGPVPILRREESFFSSCSMRSMSMPKRRNPLLR